MPKRKRSTDPHAAREAQNYDRPVPSREFILEHIQSSERGLSRYELLQRFDIEDDPEAEEGVRRRLIAMARDGQLARGPKGRYLIAADVETHEGVVQGHRDGFGFVVCDDADEDVFLANGQMRGVFDGDRVLVEVTRYDRRGKKEGRIKEVLERNTSQLVGRFGESANGYVVSADSQRMPQDILIDPKHIGNAREGDYVLVAITKQPDWHRGPEGEVLDVLGDMHTPGVATEVAIHAHGIPVDWPEAVTRQAAAFAAEPLEEDKKARVDLRDKPLVTIDGEDARDFDDAVYCEKKLSGGWRLWVAIADVSHYVLPDSPLDKEAQHRGTSVYFPDRVVPMLPEALSNGLCSLKPDVDRLCMVAEMTVSKAGRLSGYRFYEAVMRSHARLTYNQVAAILDMEGGDPAQKIDVSKPVRRNLDHLQNVFRALQKERAKRGAIEFETVETKIRFDEERRIDAIVPTHRNDAHRLIEECMLCANVAAAALLQKHKLEALYRVHEGPNEKKLANLRDYLGELGLNLPGGDKPSPQDYQKLLAEVRTRADGDVIQTMMLRSLSQAVYTPENEGHFGLSYKGYTHFTSPIRRYPDLLVHRAIRYLVRSKSDKTLHKVRGAAKMTRKEGYPYDMPALAQLGQRCSANERRADEASRDVLAWLKCEFLESHVGDEFDGVITAVTGFGLFVELADLYIEGLVHVSALGQDFYNFDAAKQRLVGEHSRKAYQLGDSIKVQVLRVAVEERKIDLGAVNIGPKKDKKQTQSWPSKRKSGGAGKGGGKGRGAGAKAKAKADKGGGARTPRRKKRS